MKKLSLILITVLCAILLIPSASAKNDKVTVYMFRGEGCGYCKKALAYFSELVKDEEIGSKFELKTYEVWNNQDNSALMTAVGEELEEEVNGVPFIVIGNKTFHGYAESFNSEIEEAINDNYNSKSYEDVVARVVEEKKYTNKVEVTTLDDITIDSNSTGSTTTGTTEETEKKSNTGVIIGITCIVIGGLAALIYVSRS